MKLQLQAIVFDIVDKVHIILTAAPSDLLSPDGLRQVKEIAKLQVDYYIDNPAEALLHLVDAKTRRPEIIKAVMDYAIEHGTKFEVVMDAINPLLENVESDD